MISTLNTLDRPEDHMPPITVMPINTTALVIMPVFMVNTSGIRVERMEPPATYCSEVMQDKMMARPMTLMMRAFLS